jgi:hypothetical protein
MEILQQNTIIVLKYDTALMLWKVINKRDVWTLLGSLDAVTEKHMPQEFYSFLLGINLQDHHMTLSSD